MGSCYWRPGHVPYLQVVDIHHRLVLADRGRGLVQVVAAAVADTGMDALNFVLQLIARCVRRKRNSCCLKLLSGA